MLPLRSIQFLLLLLLLLCIVVKSNPFTSGNVVVLVLGSDNLPYSTARTQNKVISGSLFEYTSSGTLVQTIPLSSNTRLSFSTNDIYGSQLSRSEDNRYLFVSGFESSEGAINVDATLSNKTARVIGKIKFDGSIDTSMRIKSCFNGGLVRCIASDSGDDIYLFGTDTVNGDRVVIFNTSAIPYSDYDTIQVVQGKFRGCDIQDDRLFGSGDDGYIYAIEDLHSYEPGLPDAIFDPAFPPTIRKVTTLPDLSIGGLQFTGEFPNTLAWVGSQSSCLNQFSFIDQTPISYVKDFGYLDAGNDLYDGNTLNLTYAGATTLCDSISICAGFTFFWNASYYNPPRPWTPQTYVGTYLKGPFFYFTQMDETVTETWWTFQKPQTSGNFYLQKNKTVSQPCISSKQSGIFNLADNEDILTGNVQLFFTTLDGTQLYMFDNTAQTTRLIATAPQNTVFRGVAMAPFYGPIPSPNPSKKEADLSAGNLTESIVIPLVMIFLLSGIVWIYAKEKVMTVFLTIGNFVIHLSGGTSPSSQTRFYGEKVSLLSPIKLSAEEAKRRTSPIKV
jgi:hypothetical protein